MNKIGNAFVFIFTFESMLKIFAIGLVNGKNAYFRSSWNILDFIIVIAGLVEFVLDLAKI